MANISLSKQKVSSGIRIGNIAKALGISQRALRYYEELGFINSQRTKGGFREYPQTEIERLNTILNLKRLGLSLAEIREILAMKDCIGDKRRVPKLVEKLHEYLHNFEDKLEEYKRGIKEIKEILSVIEECSYCNKDGKIIKCARCIKKKGDGVPNLLKAMISLKEGQCGTIQKR